MSTHTHTHACTHARTQTHAYARKRTHARTHTHKHTNTNTKSREFPASLNMSLPRTRDDARRAATLHDELCGGGGGGTRPAAAARLSAGAEHSAAVTPAGRLWLWGSSNRGQLGPSPAGAVAAAAATPATPDIGTDRGSQSAGSGGRGDADGAAGWRRGNILSPEPVCSLAVPLLPLFVRFSLNGFRRNISSDRAAF